MSRASPRPPPNLRACVPSHDSGRPASLVVNIPQRIGNWIAGEDRVPDGDSWQLADVEGEGALPLSPAARARPGLWRLVALSGGAPVTVFGECGHRGFTPLTAWPEHTGEAVPLC